MTRVVQFAGYVAFQVKTQKAAKSAVTTSSAVTNNLNMGTNKIISLSAPTSDTDASTKNMLMMKLVTIIQSHHQFYMNN